MSVRVTSRQDNCAMLLVTAMVCLTMLAVIFVGVTGSVVQKGLHTWAIIEATK